MVGRNLIKRLLCFAACVILLLGALAGCGEPKLPEVTDEQIQETKSLLLQLDEFQMKYKPEVADKLENQQFANDFYDDVLQEIREYIFVQKNITTQDGYIVLKGDIDVDGNYSLKYAGKEWKNKKKN